MTSLRFSKAVPLLVLAVLCRAESAVAQSAMPAASPFSPDGAAPAAQAGRRIWVGIGVGGGTVGLTAQGDASLLAGPHLYRARISGHTHYGDVAPGTEVPVDMMEVSLMYGRGTWTPGGNWISAAAGAGLVSGSDELRPERDFTAPGIAVEAQFISRRLPRLSITALGNLNPEQSVAAITVGLVIGRAP